MLEKQFMEIAAQGDPAKFAALQKQLEAGAIVIDAEAMPVETQST